MERARRPLRPPRRRPVQPRLRPAAPAGSAPSATGYNADPQRIIEARPQRRSLRHQGRTDLALGQRVFHDKFGYGTITAIEGNKLEIDFEKAGQKRVIDSFVSAGD